MSKRRAESNIARKSFKASGGRNFIAAIAIALTCVLFTAVFTIGNSMMEAMQQSAMRQVGTSAHAGFKHLSQEQYDTLAKDTQIEDISYNILVATGENKAFSKRTLEIRYTEEKSAEWGFQTPTTGRLPKEKMEVAMSSGALDLLGIEHKLGEEVTLEFTANGVKHSDIFALCGFWKSDKAITVESAFVSREYCEAVAPVWQGEIPTEAYMGGYVSGGINPALWFGSSWDIETQVNALMERCGFDSQRVNSGVNWAYAGDNVGYESIVLIAVVLLLICASGYLIIYNVFYISIAKDIRFYGLLKTIGAERACLRKIVLRQAMMVSLIGVPIGLVLGYLCGNAVAPYIMQTTTLIVEADRGANVWVFLAAAAFTVVTVMISCIKPCRLVSKISPVEAVRFTSSSKTKKKKKATADVTPTSMAIANMCRNKKKVISVITSLSLSLTLLMSIFTLVNGFSVNEFLRDLIATDFIIADESLFTGFSQSVKFNSITPDITEDMKKIDGVQNIGNIYMHEAEHETSEQGRKNTLEIIDKNYESMPMPYAEKQLDLFKQTSKLPAHIFGVDEFSLTQFTLFEGELDYQKLATGKYVIVNNYGETAGNNYYNIGDKVMIDAGNGVQEYEIMAIANIKHAAGPQHSHFIDVNFVLAREEYIAQHGKDGAMNVVFDVADDKQEAADEIVSKYCEDVGRGISYKSRLTFEQEFENMQNMLLIAGGALSGIMALIGILNFINAITTSIIARRRELATLQSIGMTGAQMRKMLIIEGVSYAAITLAIVATFGSSITYGFVSLVSQVMWYFVYEFTILPLLIVAPILLAISAIVPWISYKSMQKQSVVERLREGE